MTSFASTSCFVRPAVECTRALDRMSVRELARATRLSAGHISELSAGGRSVGCSQNALTTRFPALGKDLPQVKRRASHSASGQLGRPMSSFSTHGPPTSQHFRGLVRPGDVGTKRTTMVADMGSERGRESRLAEVYVRSAPAGFRLAYRPVEAALHTSSASAPKVPTSSPPSAWMLISPVC
jgi:hypothetical protein